MQSEKRSELLGRRTLLEWLGNAVVLSLASPILQTACRQDPSVEPEFPGPGDADAQSDGPEAEAGQTGNGCDGFKPGQVPSKFSSWPVRTVDQQDLASLLATWKLRIDGLVQAPLTISFCELLAMGLSDQVTDFHCVEGWSVFDVPWNGIPLQKLMGKVKPGPSAKYLKVTCAGGKYTESLPLSVALEPKTLLGLGIGGNTLPVSHGFPARIVVPRLLGYKNPKFVEHIELVETEHVGYWPNYGYPVSGEVPASRLRPGKY